MILQCPACSTQYRLKQNNISDEGRRVKCAKCQHAWIATQNDLIEDVQQVVFEKQAVASVGGVSKPVVKEIDLESRPSKNIYVVPEIVSESDGILPDSISSEVKLSPQSAAFQASQDNDAFLRNKPSVVLPREAVPRFTVANDKSKKPLWPVLLVVTLILVALITSLILMRKSVVKAWEGSARLYEMIGLHVPVLGEGLKFENLKTSFDRNPEGGKFMIIEGDIKNVSTDEKIIPLIKIVPYKREDKALMSAKVKVNAEKLKPGESANFKTQLPPDTRLNARDEFSFYED